MADGAHDPRLDAAFAHLRQATETASAPAQRSRTQSAHQQPPYSSQQQLNPPPSDAHEEPEATDPQPQQQQEKQQRVRTLRSRPVTQHAAVANGRETEGRIRSASGDRKGGDLMAIHHGHQHQRQHHNSVVAEREPQLRTKPQMYTAAPPVKASYNEQREQQRLRQAELARRMAASTASSTSVAYMEMVSPVRPFEIANAVAQERMAQEREQGVNHVQGRATAGSAVGAIRREAPSTIMQEFDDELSRSEGEHERPSVGMSRDVAEMEDHDADDERDQPDDETREDPDAHPQPTAQSSPPLPVVPVRVRTNDQRQQRSYPPFREEISSDVSEHKSLQSAPSSSDSHGNPYFPQSAEMYSVPSISLTPPASPRHQRTTNHHQQRADHEQHQYTPNDTRTYAETADSRPSGRDRYPDSEPGMLAVGFFSSWTFGFTVGCLVAGFGGMFMEELMELAGVFLKTSSFTLSRAEQREMNRRLDVLQEELLNFRASTNDIEHQSQRMVQEVRSHLVKMKTERERHQQMISKEMDTLRMYVQAITTELVEDEKKEIRKRLMETIADTNFAGRSQKTSQEGPGQDSHHSGLQSDLETQPQTDVQKHETPVVASAIEVELAQDGAASLFEPFDEESVMQQIDKAISPGVHELPSDTKKNNSQRAALDAPSDSASSPFSWELLIVLTGIALIAAAVGKRVQMTNRRKHINRSRRLWRRQPDPEASKYRKPTSGEESEVETVEFFRNGSESGLDNIDDGDSGDVSSVYSEELKETEEDEDTVHREEERNSMESEESEHQFQAAQLDGEISEIEEIDESPSFNHDEPPTPYRRASNQRSHLEDRLTDESPVRRSPRLQGRSNLTFMR